MAIDQAQLGPVRKLVNLLLLQMLRANVGRVQIRQRQLVIEVVGLPRRFFDDAAARAISLDEIWDRISVVAADGVSINGHNYSVAATRVSAREIDIELR